MPRELVEKNLEFLGLVILENRLKEPTVGVIKKLRDANIHVIMITGKIIKIIGFTAKYYFSKKGNKFF